MISLWISTVFLIRNRGKKYSLLTALPATFMTGVSVTYILMAKEGFRLDRSISYPIGMAAAAALFAIYVLKCRNMTQKQE